jgi:hypothetical protein
MTDSIGWPDSALLQSNTNSDAPGQSRNLSKNIQLAAALPLPIVPLRPGPWRPGPVTPFPAAPEIPGLKEWASNFIRSNMDLAHFLGTLINKPSDDQEPEKTPPQPKGEIAKPGATGPNPGPDGPLPPVLPTSPDGGNTPNSPRLSPPNERQPDASPELNTQNRLDRVRAERDARRAAAEQDWHNKTSREAFPNAPLKEDEIAWLREDQTGRRVELAYDSAQKKFRVQEAQTALAAEESGAVSGPLRRALGPQEKGGDYYDRDGTLWDVTRVDKVSTTIKDIGEKAHPPRPGEKGENVLADLRHLSPADARRAVDDWRWAPHSPGTGRVQFVMPKEP